LVIFRFKGNKIFDRVLRVGVLKDKWLKKSGQSISPTKSLFKKRKSRTVRRCSNVLRFNMVNKGIYEVCGSLGMEHLIEMKRKNFRCIFSNLDLLPD